MRTLTPTRVHCVTCAPAAVDASQLNPSGYMDVCPDDGTTSDTHDSSDDDGDDGDQVR